MSHLQKIIKWFPALIVFASPLYLVRFKLGWFSTNVLEIMIVGFVLIWLILKAIYKIPPSLPLKREGKNNYLWPIALILAGALSSSLASIDPKTSFGILKSWFVLPAFFGWAMADLIKQKEDIKRILIALISSGAVVSFISLFYFWQGKLTFDGRLAAFYLSPNHLAMYLAPAFLVSLFLGFSSKKTKEKFIYFAACVAMGIALYFTFSYAAWLGIFGGIAFVIARSHGSSGATKQSRDITGENIQREGGGSNSGLPAPRSLGEVGLRHPRRLGFLAMTTIFLILFSLLPLGNAEKFSNLLAFNRSSLESRLMIWRSAGLILKDHWFLGIGPGNFQEQYLAYQKYFPPYLEWAVPQPHNLFLAFWLQTGLIGLAGFIWLYILLLKINLSLWLKQKEPIALALLAVLIYILIHGFLDTPLWKNDLSLIFAVIVVLSLFPSFRRG